MLSLVMIFALEFTMPTWTTLLAVWLLYKRMTPSRIDVIVFGLIGVLLLLRPDVASFNPVAMFVLLAALGFALTTITTKILT